MTGAGQATVTTTPGGTTPTTPSDTNGVTPPTSQPGGVGAPPPPVGAGDVNTPPPPAGPADAPPADAPVPGGTAGMGAPMEPPPRVPGDGTCLQGAGDFSGEGPYQITQYDVDLGGGLGGYTVFHPVNLEAACPHPIVSWGNGTGVTGSTTYGAYHRHAASWGIVTIAAHNANAGSMPFIEAGIDYLLAQNDDAASPLFGKLSTRAGVSGHSQGGIAATSATSHPNVEAEVCVQGGGFGVPANVAFMCQTGVEDFLRGMCTSTYQSAAGPSFLLDHQTADHIGTPTIGLTTSEPGGQYVRTSTAWFRCWLADDATACDLFGAGAGSPICSQSDWATCDSRNF